MIIETGRVNVVSCFFGEDLSVICIFQWERNIGLCLLSGNGEFDRCGELGNDRGVWKEVFTIASEHLVDKMVIQRMLEVLVLYIMAEVIVERSIIDSVYVYVLVCSGEGLLEGVMLLGICSVGGVEIF